MFSFPRFKNAKNHNPYKQQSLERWESILLKLFGLIILLEVASIIEYSGIPNVSMKQVFASQGFGQGFYLLAILGRYWAMKLWPKHKMIIANLTDLLLLIIIIVVLVVSYFHPIPAPSVLSVIWISKEAMKFMASYLVLSTTFFNWFYGPLIILAVLVYIITVFSIDLPGQEQLYMPSYCALLTVIMIFGYMFERIKRNSFEAQIEAVEQEKVWKDILNVLPEGVLVVNKSQDVVYINQAVKDLLNIQSSDESLTKMEDISKHLDMTITNLQSPTLRPSTTQNNTETSYLHSEFAEQNQFHDLKDRIWASWSNLESTFSKEPSNYTIYKGVIKTEGREKSIDIKFAMKEFARQTVAFFIFSDISSRILVDSLKQTIEYKNRLLASVSHELRTPLNGNINFIEMAIHAQKIPKMITEKYLYPALRSAKYLLTIINDILDFSQIQHEKLRIVATSDSIVKTAQDAIDLFEIQAKKKGVQLTMKRPNDTWDVRFHTDHNRLTQIITNLISNALKFTMKGSITVALEDYNNKYIRIEVQDTGTGISKENQAKLFQQFTRLESAHQYLNPQGVGLGLLISNELAKMLGPRPKDNEILGEKGGIVCESEPNVGSKFFFVVENMAENFVDPAFTIPPERSSLIELPMQTPEQPLRVSRRILSSAPSSEISSERKPFLNSNCQCPEILVADDEGLNLLAIEHVLGALGYKPALAYNGEAVLEQVQQRMENPCGTYCKPFGIIFLDCSMPIMDGYDCATKLKELYKVNPQLSSTLIACTAAVGASERKKALESGMDEFVSKPLSKARVKELLSQFLLTANKI